MRSRLVYEAGLKVKNRFLLASIVMQAVRKMHAAPAPTEDTVNRVFAKVATAQYAHGQLPDVTPSSSVDALLIPPSPKELPTE